MTLSEKQQNCNHAWGFASEDFLTGSRKQDCSACGARRQLPSRMGTPAWKAQMMMKYEGLESCTIEEGERWADRHRIMLERLEGYKR